jgi:hypothetical protein
MVQRATSPAGEPEISDEDIRRRAYEISSGPDAGTEEENWIRAEEELRGSSGMTSKSTTSKRAPSVRKRAEAGSKQA